MNYRTTPLLVTEDLGPSGTKVIPLDLDQPISRIDVRFQTTRASTGMSAGTPANITRLEIVDGSEKLWSATGYEAQAMAYYNHPGKLFSHGQHLSGSSEMDVYRIDFGRWLWDELLAFLPSRFKNPQLRIGFDEDVADTGVTANECEVLAYVFDDKLISPLGFLSLQEWFDYTVGANNSYETILLPEDHSIRQMLVRAYRDAFEPWAQIDEARLDENNGQRFPFDFTNLENYFRTNKANWPAISYPMQTNASAGGVVTYVPTTEYWAAFLGLQQSGGVVAYITAGAGKGGKLTILAASSVQITGVIEGWLPWHCFQFPMGLQDVIEDWYNPRDKSPRLRLRAASSGTNGTGQVILEQLRRY